MRAGFAIALLLLPALGCEKEDPPDPREAQFLGAVAAVEEARELIRRGRGPAAHETLLRAYDQALGALRIPGDRPRAEILNLLSNVSLELGSGSPPYLVRAIRYADLALREDPGWLIPRFNMAVGYARAGVLETAVVMFRELLRDHQALVREHPGLEIGDPGIRDGLIATLLAWGMRSLSQDRADAEVVARRRFEEAWALAPDRNLNRGVHDQLTRLNQNYAERANAAIESGDQLETARVHASFGHFIPAEEALKRASDGLGYTAEVRWVEARYIWEMRGTEDALDKAIQRYEKMIALGERVVHASAGLARCMRGVGRGPAALDRVGGFPEPSPELRGEIILLRLDRIRALPKEDVDAANAELEQIEVLFTGGLDPEDRASLMLEAAIVAHERAETDRLAEWIRRFRERFPDDRRVVILEVGLQDLQGEPIDVALAGEQDD